MKGLTHSIFLIVLTLCPFLNACKEESKQDCAMVACTEEIITIEITIKDKNGNPVVLDDYYTFIDSRNRFTAITANTELGEYTVATDANMDLIDEDGTVLIFVGLINDENVVEHQMEIGKDCCHIILLAGETTVIID